MARSLQTIILDADVFLFLSVVWESTAPREKLLRVDDAIMMNT